MCLTEIIRDISLLLSFSSSFNVLLRRLPADPEAYNASYSFGTVASPSGEGGRSINLLCVACKTEVPISNATYF